MGVRVPLRAPSIRIDMSQEYEREPNAAPVDIENLEHFAKVRYAICRECEHYRMYLCGKCGCFMPAKVRFRNMNCPIGRWKAVDDTD